jgi:hypothetical protein
LPTLDPGSDIDDTAKLAQRELLLQALGRPMAVIVRRVLGQDMAQVPFAEDQYVVQALACPRISPRKRSPLATGQAS